MCYEHWTTEQWALMTLCYNFIFMYAIWSCECVRVFSVGGWIYSAKRIVSFGGRSVVARLDKDLDKGQVNRNAGTGRGFDPWTFGLWAQHAST